MDARGHAGDRLLGLPLTLVLPAAVRLHRLSTELGPALTLEHRAFPLRPVKAFDRFLADYRAGLGRSDVIADDQAAVKDGVRAIPGVIFPGSGRAIVGLVDLAADRAAVEEAVRC